ncbi:MAG: putative peptidoglycan glycosyltransferase FtsW [Verrucomicrobiota bacterium]|nr:putative peptidoglycan glycosyltransferase FtsW [Verrucomicrobiota bacterium]MDD8046310.1 putative peptidoglycan glycosyltransferase FtsW [Verrucomicrobiota bacterium]MDD8050792.1 putative peptidoglycan glycosyltransferase FtsW [Verrucomicrobiota bacterium]
MATSTADWRGAARVRRRKRLEVNPLTAPVRCPLVPVIAFCIFMLLGVSLIMLFSVEGARGGGSAVLKQALFGVAGAIGLLLLWIVPYQRLTKWSVMLYLGMICVLIIVLLVGVEKNGARRWLLVVPMYDVKVQPSEFARPTLILVLAWYFQRYRGLMHRYISGILVPLGLAGVLCGLVLLERDFGQTAFLGCLCIGMMFIAGSRWIPMGLTVLLLGVVFLGLIMMDPVRRGRVEAFLQEHEQGTVDAQISAATNYQADQSVLAIQEGAILGRGLVNGYRKEGRFVPEATNDFIFSVIGEELGLVGTLGVVFLYGVLILAGTVIAFRAPDATGMLIASGLTLNLGGQALLNLLVVTKLFVNKGLPLPFISQGGSNLVMHLACMGILLNIYVQGQAHRRRRQVSPLPLRMQGEHASLDGTIDF